MLAVGQFVGGGAQGDVDAQQALPGVEAAQHSLGGCSVRTRERDARRRLGGAQLGSPPCRHECDDSRGDECGLAEPDRR